MSLQAALTMIAIDTVQRSARGNSGSAPPVLTPGNFPQPDPVPGYTDPPLERVVGWARKGGFPGKGKVKAGMLGNIGDGSAATGYVIEPDAVGSDRYASALLAEITTQQGFICPLVVDSDNWVGTSFIPFNAGPGQHRAWRVRQADGSYTGDYMGCAELQLRGSMGGADVATGKTITASATAGGVYSPSSAIDDNAATFFTTGANAAPVGGHWLLVDAGVGNTFEVLEFAYMVRPDGFREDPVHLVLEYTDNMVDFTTAIDAPSLAVWTAGEQRVFSYGETGPARLIAMKNINGVRTQIGTVNMPVAADDRIGGIVYAGDYYITHEGAVVAGPFAVC